MSLGQWQGKVLLINFWATWCGPCREEIPHLIDAQRRYGRDGVQIIGIALDGIEKVAPFSTQLGINYPILIDEGGGMMLARRLGNRAGVLPYTALIDRQGRVILRRAGALTASQIEAELAKLI